MRYKIEIVLTNVGPGDVDQLADDILTEFGDAFDAARGEMVVTKMQQHDHETGWFMWDPEA